MYKNDHGKYPEVWAGQENSVSSIKDDLAPYLSTIPEDPTGNGVVITSDGTCGKVWKSYGYFRKSKDSYIVTARLEGEKRGDANSCEGTVTGKGAYKVMWAGLKYVSGSAENGGENGGSSYPSQSEWTDASCFTFSNGEIRKYKDDCPKDVIIPQNINGEKVKIIRGYAFYNKQIKSVTIPDSVKSIGNIAFTNNELKSVTIPNSVKSIGNAAFNKNQLESVIIPNSVRSMGNSAFSSNQLKSVVISDSVTSIEGAAFYENQLESVTIPNSVKSIGSAAFYNNELKSVTIPNSVKSIGYNAFTYNQLESVTIPDSVKSIGYNAFNENPLKSIIIPESVTSIERYAFWKDGPTSPWVWEKVNGAWKKK